jgi:elongation factor 1-gamma
MSADDQQFLDTLTQLPRHVQRYGNEVVDFINNNVDQAAHTLRETLSAQPWIPDSIRPTPPVRAPAAAVAAAKKKKGGKEETKKEEPKAEKGDKKAAPEKKETKPAEKKEKKEAKPQEKKPAEKKEAKPKAAAEEEEEEPKEKKLSNPLDSLPPSSFNLFDFKTLIVNAPNKKDAVKTFFEQFDPQGYSIWHITYDKAEGEGKVLFLTNNLMNGFLQRLEHFRKYAFAVHGVYGDEPNLEIRGLWVWRGTEIPNEIKEHDSYDFHKFTKLDHTKEEDRKKVEEYWAGLNEDEDIVDGLTVRTCRWFK